LLLKTLQARFGSPASNIRAKESLTVFDFMSSKTHLSIVVATIGEPSAEAPVVGVDFEGSVAPGSTPAASSPMR
jgi:hypothetical protein